MSLKFAKQCQLNVSPCKSVSKVRLANGKIVETVGIVQLTIIFGQYHFIGRFQLLDCSVPLILGMEFLDKVQPEVDFAMKRVAVVHKKCTYQLPTCVIDNCGKGPDGQLVCTQGSEQPGMRLQSAKDDIASSVKDDIASSVKYDIASQAQDDMASSVMDDIASSVKLQGRNDQGCK